MHTFLIVVIISGGLGLISASIPASTIDSDSIDISNISQDFKKFSPAVARRLTEATCQMISQCCPQIQSNFLSMTLSGDTNELTNQCFGEKSSSTFLSKILSCSPLVRMTTMVTNPQLIKYMSIITKKSAQDKEDMKLILHTCSQEEILSIACDWNPSDQQNTCQRKILQIWAEQGDKIYTDKVQQTKEEYNKLIDELKKEFNN